MKTSLLDLRCMDCMDFLRDTADNAFDLAIVDPPYGIGASEKNNVEEMKSKKSAAKSRRYGDQRWDDAKPCQKYFTELKRVSERQIIWGANYFGLIGGMLFWDKRVSMPSFSKGEIAYISWLNSVDMIKLTWHGMIQHDMKNKEHRIHPTQKPVALYNLLLHKYAKPGDRILDTHMGSRSIAIACHYKGHHLTACELDPDYYKAACERIERETAQLDMFAINAPISDGAERNSDDRFVETPPEAKKNEHK